MSSSQQISLLVASRASQQAVRMIQERSTENVQQRELLFRSSSQGLPLTERPTRGQKQPGLSQLSVYVGARAEQSKALLESKPDSVSLSLPPLPPRPTFPIAPTKIPHMPLAIPEDCNGLSDFNVFVRKELVEVCFATSEDVAVRNISQQVALNQVGIRCRLCANMDTTERPP
jgi:hypothetical protein